jgi:hypothetical protein
MTQARRGRAWELPSLLAWHAVDVPRTPSRRCLNIDQQLSTPAPRTFPLYTPPAEDQARLLEDALAVVRQQTMLMRRCLETPGKLMDALKCRYELQYLHI